MIREVSAQLEHRHRIERVSAPFAGVAIAKQLDKPAPKMLEINRPLQNLKPIAARAQRFKAIVKAEKRLWFHRQAPD